MKRLMLLGIFALSLSALFATQKPVPAEEEPKHKVVLKNEYVEVIRATLQPGESTLYHIHSHDRAGVDLVSSTTTEQLWGKAVAPASTSKAGEVFAEDCSAHPKTHRVQNVGKGPMDVIYLDALQPPSKVPATAAGPVAAENPSERVYNWTLAPGASTPMHTHDRPYLIVAVTDMQLRMSAPDGSTFAHPIKSGDFHWIAEKVTHNLSNEGHEAGQIVEIELK